MKSRNKHDEFDSESEGAEGELSKRAQNVFEYTPSLHIHTTDEKN